MTPGELDQLSLPEHTPARCSAPFRGRRTVKAVAHKRGPRTPQTDEQLLVYIKAAIAASPLTGQGHRKIRYRLLIQ